MLCVQWYIYIVNITRFLNLYVILNGCFYIILIFLARVVLNAKFCSVSDIGIINGYQLDHRGIIDFCIYAKWQWGKWWFCLNCTKFLFLPFFSLSSFLWVLNSNKIRRSDHTLCTTICLHSVLTYYRMPVIVCNPNNDAYICNLNITCTMMLLRLHKTSYISRRLDKI